MVRMIVGSGWHPRLFREEVLRIHGSDQAIHPRIVITDQQNNFEVTCSHSTMTLDNATILPMRVEEISESIRQWLSDYSINDTFAVRTTILGDGVPGFKRRNIEGIIGKEISDRGAIVDLNDPELTVRLILAGAADQPQHPDPMISEPIAVIGIENPVHHPFLNRPMTSMPFFKPVTLDPRLASLLISMSYSEGAPPSIVIDPFSGTGCIPIQAHHRGIPVLASDLDPEMVRGSKLNFENVFGKIPPESAFHRSDVSKISNLWGARENAAFIFDPPYARNSKTSSDAFEVFISACNAASKIDPEGRIVTILPTSSEYRFDDLEIPDAAEVLGRKWSDLIDEMEQIGWQIELATMTRVHRSLSRIIVRAVGQGT
jgi:predicted RNA methylase